MNYRDYKDARDASWRILIDCKVTELPVKISGVCRALGVSVRRYTPAEQDNHDGMSTVIGGAPTTAGQSRISFGKSRPSLDSYHKRMYRGMPRRTFEGGTRSIVFGTARSTQG